MDEELDAAAREVQRLAAEAQAELMRLIQVSSTLLTVQKVKTIQQGFNSAFVDLMTARLNNVPNSGNVWDVRMVKDMKVGDVSLSQRLYTNAQQTSQHVAALVKEHAQGQMQARDMAIRLYDGYNPKDGIVRPLEGAAARAKLPKALKQLTANPVDRAALQKVFEQGQNYARALKTEPLKAAYLQALTTWEKDKGAASLERALEIAHKEKTRYMANRIAQTELARAHQHALADTLMADETISVVQVQMSASHPIFDVCNLHANADLWGLGPGCYPKEKAPKPTYHPFCRCRIRSRPSLQAAMARETPGGEAAYLRSLPIGQAAKIAGSRTRLEQILNGAKFDDVVNAGRDSLYRLERMGDVVDSKHSKLPLPAFHGAMKEYDQSMPNRISPVSDALYVPPSPKYDQVRKALTAIDVVHDDGRLPKTTVMLAPNSTDLGEYVPKLNRLNVRPGQNEIDTVFHEVAHMLDYHAFGSGHAYESLNPTGMLNGFVSAALKSEAAQEWHAIKVQSSREYLLDPSEIWARAYTQWVATKTATYVNFNAEIGYWTDADFVPIVREIENAFRLEGWL